MLKPIPFANALALATAIFYIILYSLGNFAPDLFELIFNAQYLGADIASLYQLPDLTSALTILVVISATGWLFGYVWATLYNKFLKD